MIARAVKCAALAVALLPALAVAAAANCTVYQHRDYGGAHWYIRDGAYLAGVGAIPNLGCYGCPEVHYRPDWNDQISSFKVGPGCTIMLWQHVDGSRSPPRGHGATFRSSRSVSFVGGRWNDQASLVHCRCR